MSKPRTPVLTPKELAAFLKVSLPTVRRYVSNGTIPYFEIGNRVRFNTDDVLRALKKKREAPTVPPDKKTE